MKAILICVLIIIIQTVKCALLYLSYTFKLIYISCDPIVYLETTKGILVDNIWFGYIKSKAVSIARL